MSHDFKTQQMIDFVFYIANCVTDKTPKADITEKAKELVNSFAESGKAKKVRIVSGGNVIGTKVYFGNDEIENITAIKIEPLTTQGGLVKASIELSGVELDLELMQEIFLPKRG